MTPSITYHIEEPSREWYPLFKWPAFDWQTALQQVKETTRVHREERGIWWRARRRRLTQDYVIHFEDGLPSFHVYVHETLPTGEGR